MVFDRFDIDKIYETDKELKKEDVLALMDWASKKAHLPKISEHEAIFTLHSCYYRVEPAKITLDNYFTARTHFPDLFHYDENDRMVPIQFDILYISILPKRTPDDDMILFLKLKDTNPDLFNNAAAVKAVVMAPTLFVYQYGPSNGFRAIIDFTGATLSHLTRLNPVVMKNFLGFLQEAMPVRLKSVHFINMVSWIDRLMLFLKPFLKKELLEMIHFNHNIEELFEVVPKEMMPNEYGGQAGTLDELKEKNDSAIMDNFDFFLKYNEMVVDEKKRTGELSNELFGTSGNFKQLAFD